VNESSRTQGHIQSHRQLVGDQTEFYAQLQKLTNLSISEEDGTLSIREGKYDGETVGQFGFRTEYGEQPPYMFIGLIKNKKEYRGQGIFQKLTAMVVKYTDGLEKIKLRASHFKDEIFPHTYYAQKLGFLTDEMSEEDAKLWTNGPPNPSGTGHDFAATPRGEEMSASPSNIDKWLRCFRFKQIFSEDGFQSGDTGHCHLADTLETADEAHKTREDCDADNCKWIDPEDLETTYMASLRDNFCDEFNDYGPGDISALMAWPCLDMYLDIREGERPEWLRREIKTLDEMEKTGASYPPFEPL